MIRPHPQRDCRGHSLVELMTAMVSSAILLAGLGAVMMIARQIAYTPTASTARLQASAAVNRLTDELRCATWIIEQTALAIEFVVADRDGDGAAERIRYEWSGTPGDALERTLNGGAVVPVAEDVQDFQLGYTYVASTDRLYPASDSAETLLAWNTSVAIGGVRSINNQLWVSQQINPSIPVGASSWNATRMDFYGRRNGTSGTTLLVQLRSSGAPNNGPTSEVLGSASVTDSMLLASNGWNSVTFASTIRGLSPSLRYNLVWASSNGSTACILPYVDSAPGSGVSETSGSYPETTGASWQYYSSRRIYYRLYGTYTTAGTPVDVTRTRVSSVSATLQTDDASHSRIQAGIPLANEPELVSAVWRADFEPDQPDPTTIDGDGDDNLDWAMNSGSFNDNWVGDGIWTVSGTLETRPLNDFTGVTFIDARCRNGAVLRINADRQGGTHGPLIVRVVKSDDEQTLTLSGETAAAVEKTLTTIERLSTDWVRFRLLIVPQQNIVNLKVDDQEVGTYTYPTYNTATNNRFLSLSGNGAEAEFDYVEARVADDAIVEVVN